MSEKVCSVCETGIYTPFEIGTRYCDKHNICITCGIERKNLTDTPWGVRIGAFQCKPCEATERKVRISARQARGFEHEYEDEIVCPYCGYQFGDSWECGEGENDCPECEETFEVERHATVHYSTTKRSTPTTATPQRD